MYRTYLEGLMGLTGCIVVTALAVAIVAIVGFYTYRAVRWVIKNHSRNMQRITESKAFDFQKIQVVEDTKKKASSTK